MADNTPGFEFNENPASPNSEASAVNLNNLVKRAIIRNIAPDAVTQAHISASVAGAGLGGGSGTALNVKTDGNTIEIASDKLQLVDAPIVGTSRLINGAVTMDKLAATVKDAINNVLLNIYKVGDYFITHNTENPGNRFGGTWQLVKDRFLIGAGGDYGLLTEGGESAHTLTTAEMPSHDHELPHEILADWRSGQWLESGSGVYKPGTLYTEKTGGGQPHNNMPPYRAVYIWVKISD